MPRSKVIWHQKWRESPVIRVWNHFFHFTTSLWSEVQLTRIFVIPIFLGIFRAIDIWLHSKDPNFCSQVMHIFEKKLSKSITNFGCLGHQCKTSINATETLSLVLPTTFQSKILSSAISLFYQLSHRMFIIWSARCNQSN